MARIRRDRGLDVPVATPEVGGVTLRRHILDREAAGLAQLSQRLGGRLRRWMREMPDTRPALRQEGTNDNGFPVMVPWTHKDPVTGEEVQLIEPVMPDKDFRETFDLYSKAVLGLLKEQRERAKLKPGNGAPAIDDATFEKQLGELVRQTIVTMPKRELDELMRLRAIDVSAGDAQVVKPEPDIRPATGADEHLPTSALASDSPAVVDEREPEASTAPVDFLSELEKKP